MQRVRNKCTRHWTQGEASITRNLLNTSYMYVVEEAAPVLYNKIEARQKIAGYIPASQVTCNIKTVVQALSQHHCFFLFNPPSNPLLRGDDRLCTTSPPALATRPASASRMTYIVYRESDRRCRDMQRQAVTL